MRAWEWARIPRVHLKRLRKMFMITLSQVIFSPSCLFCELLRCFGIEFFRDLILELSYRFRQ